MPRIERTCCKFPFLIIKKKINFFFRLLGTCPPYQSIVDLSRVGEHEHEGAAYEEFLDEDPAGEQGNAGGKEGKNTENWGYEVAVDQGLFPPEIGLIHYVPIN